MLHIRRPRPWLVSLIAASAAIGFATVTMAVDNPLPSHASSEVNPSETSHFNEVRLVTTALQVVFNDHQVDQIDKYFSADFVQHSPFVSDPGREGLKRWLGRTLESIPDLRYSSDQVLVDHDRVITFSTVTGTIQKDMPEHGIKANGQTLNIQTAHIFRVRNNRIVEHWEIVDTGQLVQLALESAQQ